MEKRRLVLQQTASSEVWLSVYDCDEDQEWRLFCRIPLHRATFSLVDHPVLTEQDRGWTWGDYMYAGRHLLITPKDVCTPESLYLYPGKSYPTYTEAFMKEALPFLTGVEDWANWRCRSCTFTRTQDQDEDEPEDQDGDELEDQDEDEPEDQDEDESED
jgi:hypothetical protein